MGEYCTVEQSPTVKNANILNNHKLPAELFIIHFVTNAEILIDMNRPAEEEAIKFLSGQLLALLVIIFCLQQLMKSPLTLKSNFC